MIEETKAKNWIKFPRFHVSHIVKNIFLGGFDEYDMGGGADSYKKHWTPSVREHINILVFNRGFYPELLRFLEGKLIPYLKGIKPVSDIWVDCNRYEKFLEICKKYNLKYYPNGIFINPNKTFLKNESASGCVIRIYAWSSTTQANILSGYIKDSTSIIVDDASKFNTGQYIIVDQDNKGDIVKSGKYIWVKSGYGICRVKPSYPFFLGIQKELSK